MIRKTSFLLLFILGSSPCWADEVVILRDGSEVRLEGFVSFLDKTLLLKTPYGELKFPEGSWKPNSLVRSDACERMELHQKFLSHYISRGDYKMARDEIDSVRNLCPDKNRDADFWNDYAEAMDYLYYSENLKIAMAKIDSRRLSKELGAMLQKSDLKRLAEKGNAFDNLTEETVDIIEEQARHTSERTRNALKYDAISLMITVSDTLAKKSGVKVSKTDEIMLEYWKNRFQPKLERLPWTARLLRLKPLKKKYSLRQIYTAWKEDGSASAAWAIVDSGTALLNQRAEEARVSLSFGTSSMLYGAEIKRMYELPVSPDASMKVGDVSNLEIPADIQSYRASMEYRSLIGCGLQMYNAGPGRGRRYDCRVPYPSTINYVKTILANTKEGAVTNDTFDDLIANEVENLQKDRDPALNLELVRAVIHHESGFKPSANGRAGEKGLMQIMPETWNEVYLERERAPGCSFHEKGHDPACNIRIGVFYLNHCLGEARKQLHEESR